MRRLFIALAFLSTSHAAASPTADLQLDHDDSSCQQSPAAAADALGIGDITLFVEGQRAGAMCLSSALRLASQALLSARGRESPAAVARDSALPLSSWFDRNTAAIAGPIGADSTWPRPPPGLATETGWIFFATSPDLSNHWYWLLVDEPVDGRARVRLWTER